jgi:hypothetical protein
MSAFREVTIRIRRAERELALTCIILDAEIERRVSGGRWRAGG